MSYDYCGYGQSSGKPNESNLNKACFACYEKLKERYNLRPEQIILYGQSIGTGTRVLKTFSSFYAFCLIIFVSFNYNRKVAGFDSKKVQLYGHTAVFSFLIYI